MKIIYFTTACQKDDYISFCENWSSSLNTSIQNLHNRLIRALALTHDVEVISVRPFSRQYCKFKMLPSSVTKEGKITWHYLEIKRNKIIRFISARKQAKKIMSKMDLSDSIVLTDTLNPYLLTSSTALARKYDLPIIGICNNTPSGIHDTGRSYTTFLHSLADDLSGYITLTPGLNELFNQNNRANLTIEGVLETKFNEMSVGQFGKYILYYGSLEEKFGVYDLIRAFNELNKPDINLVIAGYHGNDEKINKLVRGVTNIRYLGMVSIDMALSLENGSLFNINPRPHSEDYDRYLIPFNVIDYLNSDSLTVSVRNSRLRPHFEEDAIWIDSNDKEDLIIAMNKALEMSNATKKEIIKKANMDVMKLYSMSAINDKVILFLKQFLKQKE